MTILGIETSCDDTGIALIESDKKGGIKVLANLVSSQIETHRPWGGVVPNLAKREHLKNLPILIDKLQATQLRPGYDGQAGLKLQDLDLIAVTNGPGLAPCLWAGVNFAKDLAQKLKKPLIGINHLKGHIYVALLEQQISNFPYFAHPSLGATERHSKASQGEQFLISKQITLKSRFPVLSLIVSGGHTQLVFSKKLGHYQIIGETLDDAAGEAFDKVAKLMGLPYPGGPEISRLAEKGNPNRFDLPRPMIGSKDFNFSFSGLKTAVLYLVKGVGPNNPEPLKLNAKNKADLAASFEQAVVDVLVHKTALATKRLKPKTLILGGGVAANKKLRETLKSKIKKDFPHVAFLLSPINMTGDNGLMIALAALAEAPLSGAEAKLLKPQKNLEAEPNLRLE